MRIQTLVTVPSSGSVGGSRYEAQTVAGWPLAGGGYWCWCRWAPRWTCGPTSPRSGRCCSGSGRSRSRQVDARRVQGRRLGKTRTQVRNGVYGMSWEPGSSARHTSARPAWRPQNLDDCAMKKLSWALPAFGCRRGPSGAGKTEIQGLLSPTMTPHDVVSQKNTHLGDPCAHAGAG